MSSACFSCRNVCVITLDGIEEYCPNLRRPVLELFLSRQVAIDQQIRDFEKGRLLCELLDRIPAIAKNPSISINERDLRFGDSCVVERWIVDLCYCISLLKSHPQSFNLADICCVDVVMFTDGHFVGLPIA
jgi:hypothetical protein